MLRIIISVPTDSDFWTHDDADVISGWVDRAIAYWEREAIAAVQRAYPKAEVSTRRVRSTLSGNGGHIVEADGPYTGPAVIDALPDILADIDWTSVE